MTSDPTGPGPPGTAAGGTPGDDEEYGLGVETTLEFGAAVARARLALRTEGFSILSEMPVRPSIGDGAGRRHLFLAVWEQLLSVGNLGGPGLDVGDHLPLSVVVFEAGSLSVVASLDPLEGLEGWDVPAAATAAREALDRVFAHMLAEPAL